jgi:hypothetical protein
MICLWNRNMTVFSLLALEVMCQFSHCLITCNSHAAARRIQLELTTGIEATRGHPYLQAVLLHSPLQSRLYPQSNLEQLQLLIGTSTQRIIGFCHGQRRQRFRKSRDPVERYQGVMQLDERRECKRSLSKSMVLRTCCNT